MAKEMSSKFQPQEVEAGKYQWWVDSGVFHPNEDPNAEPYSIVIPPPNVTGKLHLGHAWDVTLQDMIIRQKRMQGFDTLWLPGMDHAGIATQAKVEEKLRGEGLSRYDLGREKFLEQTWEWKEEYASHIREQWAKMGISVDYRRERFTLDKGLSDAVKKVFVTLYEKGLIYRGEYIINWDPKAKTSLSDIEVIHKDVEGAFYHMNYPLADGSGFLEIATTRPETLLGDTAVAVHPDDERYQALIGKTVILPLVNREIPIIADEYVEQDFGTGVVKITPAHDPNDFEVGNRHNLPRINVMNDDATMNELAGKYEGMDRFAARKAIVKDLEEAGLLVKIEKHLHSVGHSERTDVVVEPRLSKQWFVKMGPLAEQAINAQREEGDNTVNFYPPRFNDAYLRWMENIHDWVISRQLWWGHQIPAWYHKETGEVYVGMEAPSDIENWTQDPDVLDTWFSSALWPFSTMGWPDEDAADYKRYYPTNTLVTGYDILTFWVSRMMFQGLEFTGKRPFKNVLIHGLIRDSQGRKMSKSLGNGVDPMEVIEQYGADALRWFLANGSAPGQDVRYSTDKMDAAWNFINKIWNASRFVFMNLPEGMKVEDVNLTNLSLADSWIINRLNETITHVTENMEKYEFALVGNELYSFVWDDFCSWYVEMSKTALNGTDEVAKHAAQSTLYVCLKAIVSLLQPFMPFVTEEIYDLLPGAKESINLESWPTVIKNVTTCDLTAMARVISAIQKIREVKIVNDLKPSTLIHIALKNLDGNIIMADEAMSAIIMKLAKAQWQDTLEGDLTVEAIQGGSLYIPSSELSNPEEEIKKLEAEIDRLKSEIARSTGILSNQGFIAKAPAAKIENEKQKLEAYQKQYAVIEERLNVLKK